MAGTIQILRPNDIAAVHAAEKSLAERLDSLGSIVERLQRVLGLDDPRHESFFDLEILSQLIGERVVGQLPIRGMGESVKTYTVLGCVAGLVAKTFNGKLAEERMDGLIAEERQDKLLIQSLAEVFKNKCLVGPTSGSYGIALYIITEKLREQCSIEVRGLPLFGADIPPRKLDIIKHYHEKEWGDLPIVEALNRVTREQDSVRKLLELVADQDNTIDGGFFVPTNPASMADLEKLAATIIDKAANLSEVPEWKQDILSNLGIAVDTTNNTLTINAAYADHIAGTELFAKAILEKFPDVHVNILYPISAGAGALGPLRQAEKYPDRMHVLLASDPANKAWQNHRDQDEQTVFDPYYKQPAMQIGGTVAMPSNGMGSTPQPRIRGDAVTWLVEEGVKSQRAEFLPLTDVMRQVARAIMTLDEVYQKRTSEEPVLMQELASATSAGALLTRAIETTHDIRQLAGFATQEIFQHGFDETQFLQLIFRDEPRSEALNVADTWDEIKELAELQGNRVGDTPNKVLIFMQELQAAFAEFSEVHGMGFHNAEYSRGSIINSTSVTVITITGTNAGIPVPPEFIVKPSVPQARAA